MKTILLTSFSRPAAPDMPRLIDPIGELSAANPPVPTGGSRGRPRRRCCPKLRRRADANPELLPSACRSPHLRVSRTDRITTAGRTIDSTARILRYPGCDSQPSLHVRSDPLRSSANRHHHTPCRIDESADRARPEVDRTHRFAITGWIATAGEVAPPSIDVPGSSGSRIAQPTAARVRRPQSLNCRSADRAAESRLESTDRSIRQSPSRCRSYRRPIAAPAHLLALPTALRRERSGSTPRPYHSAT